MATLVALSVLLIFGFPSLLFGLEVRFKESAVVRGPVLALADVATILPSSESDALSGFVLFPSPSPMERRCYKSGTFKAYVLDAVGENKTIRWSGAETVCVLREEEKTTPVDIQSVIDAELEKAVGHISAEHASFEIRNLPEPVNLPPGRVEYEVLFSDPDILKSRQANVIVKVDGLAVENLAVAGRAKVLLPVVVANENLRRGTVLEYDHVRTEERNIAELKKPCLDPNSVVGKKLKRSVGMNRALVEHDLDLPVIIERRQVVTVLLQKGPLRITTKGIAKNDAKMGDPVLVKNVDSLRVVQCRAIAPGTVVVEY